MKILTAAQADLFRSVRRRVFKLDDDADKVSSELAALVCPHQVDSTTEHMPEICRVCKCYSIISSIQELINEACHLIDSSLERGPALTRKDTNG